MGGLSGSSCEEREGERSLGREMGDKQAYNFHLNIIASSSLSFRGISTVRSDNTL